MPRKIQPSDGSATCVWTNVMDDALVDAFWNQHNIGNRVGGIFTSDALNCIVNELKEKFRDKPIDKERIHNRIKNIKKLFTKWFEIQKSFSGFVWNPQTEMMEAENDAWQHLLEVIQTYSLIYVSCFNTIEIPSITFSYDLFFFFWLLL